MPSKNERNLTTYRRLSAIYDHAARIPLLERPRARLFALADIQPGQRILVVGVGTGLDLLHLPREADVTGIDLSPAMLARAEARNTNAALQTMNAEHLDFDNDSFDVVTMNCVLSVVGDPARALAEAARVLTPDGAIWILGKFYESPPGPARRVASRVLTFIGGASLTLSLTTTIGETPQRVTRHEPSLVADIFQLAPSCVPRNSGDLGPSTGTSQVRQESSESSSGT